MKIYIAAIINLTLRIHKQLWLLVETTINTLEYVWGLIIIDYYIAKSMVSMSSTCMHNVLLFMLVLTVNTSLCNHKSMQNIASLLAK